MVNQSYIVDTIEILTGSAGIWGTIWIAMLIIGLGAIALTLRWMDLTLKRSKR